ncbi:unnamed protein product [Candidula unifasciata]|uniref:G-protein coupled receptors family 1 profile domain-containing protein n=1 Tax=Candidula unifasciata TaxID=100452 RepID=A0A8S3ZJA8_9EUPU|nr:unnamed protein product [Candidula unifasciata]
MKHHPLNAQFNYSLLKATVATPELNISVEIKYLVIPKPLIEDDLYFYIMFIIQGIICQVITFFGILSNIVNCIVFIKQGFSDTINVSLFALAISDLCSLLSIMWTNFCFSPVVRDSGILSAEMHIISGTWPHVAFSKITGWITAFISLERCVCVIRPLKVKTIFTRKRHITAMVVIFVVTMAPSSLGYVTTGLGWTFFPEKNKTLIGPIHYLDEVSRMYTDFISYAICGVFMPLSCFVSVVVLTTILVVQLNKKAAWRKSVSSGTTQNRANINDDGMVTSKETRIAKMVVFMSTIFIVSFFPAALIFFTGIVEPTFNYDRLNRNLVFVTLSISFTAEVINSSVNTFVYVRMSTKYRETFMKLFKITNIHCIHSNS